MAFKMPDEYEYISDNPIDNTTKVKRTTGERERGGCLTLYLVVSAGLGALALLVSLPVFLSPRVPIVCTLFIGVILFAGFAPLWGIYQWKKWGVYGAIAFSIVSPFIEAIVNPRRFDIVDVIAPFVQIGILLYLVSDKWDYFE